MRATRVQGKYVLEWHLLLFFSQPDYKNNILKERAELAHSPLPAKDVDLDKGEHFYLLIPYETLPIPGTPCHFPEKVLGSHAKCLH